MPWKQGQSASSWPVLATLWIEGRDQLLQTPPGVLAPVGPPSRAETWRKWEDSREVSRTVREGAVALCTRARGVGLGAGPQQPCTPSTWRLLRPGTPTYLRRMRDSGQETWDVQDGRNETILHREGGQEVKQVSREVVQSPSLQVF